MWLSRVPVTAHGYTTPATEDLEISAYVGQVEALLDALGGTMATREVMERIRALSQPAADDPTPERIRTRLEWLMADNATVTDESAFKDPEVRRRNLITDDELAAITAPTVVVWTSATPQGLPRPGCTWRSGCRTDGSSSSQAPGTGRSGSSTTPTTGSSPTFSGPTR
jgi:hypothetical protein